MIRGWRASSSAAGSAVLACAMSHRRWQSEFQVNMPTSTAPHGEPRGIVNRAISQGLPPYAAWLERLDAKKRYEVSGVDPYGFLPKKDGAVDGIYLNERIRMRVKADKELSKISRMLKYPYLRSGKWYSDTLRHWVQVPQVQEAAYEIEKDGGFDNFILKRRAHELNSRFAERLRRNLLARRGEIQKNAVTKHHAKKLSRVIIAELQKATTAEELQAVCDKYGFSRTILRAIVEQRRIPAALAVKYEEKPHV